MAVPLVIAKPSERSLHDAKGQGLLGLKGTKQIFLYICKDLALHGDLFI